MARLPLLRRQHSAHAADDADLDLCEDEDGIYVNLFIGSTIKVENVAGTDVEMVQKTNYPWNGNVAITVNPAKETEFTVRVRSPQRSVSDLYSSTPEADGITSIAVNGEPVNAEIVNGYAVIRRSWKAGDKIDLELPMVPQRVKCVDDVAADRGRVALRFGPLVYNIESADGNNMDGVLASDSPLTTEWRPDLLGGVVVIKGKFADGTPLVAIPNFARNNRGIGAAKRTGGNSADNGPDGRRGRAPVKWRVDQCSRLDQGSLAIRSSSRQSVKLLDFARKLSRTDIAAVGSGSGSQPSRNP